MATLRYLHNFLVTIFFLIISIDAAALVQKRAGRTSPPAGCLTVRGSGTLSGEYNTFKAALTALGSSTEVACIFLYSGTYNEQITINYAGNLTAVAVTASGDQQGYYGCSFTGYQDTLYAKSGKQYYSNCYIEGAVDYIFGSAAAWFGECTIASNGGGAITANSRELATDSGWYVIDSSTITQANGYSLTGKVYLGRPWRALARVIFQNSVLTAVVNSAGWTTLAADATPIFEEYANTGAGSSTSARVYETVATGAVNKNTLWGNNWASWIDTSY
ncbi:hypothetical protein DID88_004080 [Monilinia fructigena]|uniref:Pectinesterase n=1 Tax=Monilinia fructigena TaxID=38457 RepID=A0A395IUA6_9HELO|nr:hypothetical protein DID88_004080 [Monilinia fructigena]